MLQYDIRRLTLADMPAASRLEENCFSSFWTEEQFVQAWKEPWFAGYGLFAGGRMIGYITLSLVADELEVLNIALLPEERGKGLSRPLMFFALQDTLCHGNADGSGAAACGWKRGILEVREENVPARSLYSSLNFVPSGLRKKYYADGENALVMTLTAEDFFRMLQESAQ